MTDLYEILKNCPKGKKLYSLNFGEVVFEGVGCEDNPTSINIKHRVINIAGNPEVVEHLDRHGACKNEGICSLFPNREHQEWNYWQEWLFDVGDYVYAKDFSIDRIDRKHRYALFCATVLLENKKYVELTSVDTRINYDLEFATPEQIAMFNEVEEKETKQN